ncbi:hypothetical protein D3C75_893270 [compost metagenome]
MKQVAGAIGTSLLVTVLTNRTQFHLAEMTSAGVTGNPQHLLQQASISGMNDAYLAVIVFGGIGLILSFFIQKTGSVETGEQELVPVR